MASGDCRDEWDSDRIWNVPNALCLFRLVGSFVLVGLALARWQSPYFWLLVPVMVSDWVDGKLAHILRQRTMFGSRLDSVADASLFGAVLVGAWILRRDYIQGELAWVGCAVGSYALTTLAGLAKFGYWPSYHTRAAKISWFLSSVSILAIFGDWNPWFLRLAMASVTCTNLEAICITFTLAERRADVPSLYHAWKLPRKRSST